MKYQNVRDLHDYDVTEKNWYIHGFIKLPNKNLERTTMIAKLVQFISYGVKKCNQNIHQKRQSNIVHLKNKTKYFNSLIYLLSIDLNR